MSVTGQCAGIYRGVCEDYRFNDSVRVLMLHINILLYVYHTLSPCPIFRTIRIHVYVHILLLLLYVLYTTDHFVLLLMRFIFINYNANCQNCTVITYLTVSCLHTISVDGGTVSCCCFTFPLAQISPAQNIYIDEWS